MALSSLKKRCTHPSARKKGEPEPVRRWTQSLSDIGRGRFVLCNSLIVASNNRATAPAGVSDSVTSIRTLRLSGFCSNLAVYLRVLLPAEEIIAMSKRLGVSNKIVALIKICSRMSENSTGAVWFAVSLGLGEMDLVLIIQENSVQPDGGCIGHLSTPIRQL